MFAWIRYSILVLILICAACTRPTELREAIHSFRAEDYRSAFIRLMPQARGGYPDAQYAIGFMYYYGKGVTEDRSKALFWIRAAACRGHIEAMEALKLIQYEAACQG